MLKINLRKILLLLVIFIICIGMLGIKSLAADDYTCTLELVPDKKEIQVGESVTFAINVSNIEAGSGIAIYNGVIDVDTNIFDLEVKPDDDNIWGVTLIEDSLTITKSNYESTNEDQTIGKIILTAKENIELGVQTLTLKSNEFSTDTESFTIGDVSANVTIVKDNAGDQNNTNTGGNSSSGGNNTNISGNNIPSNSIVPNSPNSQNAGLTLPKTGLVGDFLIIGIIVGVVAGIVTYIKYKRAV